MAKKNNHEVTRSYLELWQGKKPTGSVGLNWLDLESTYGGGQAAVKFEPAHLERGDRYKSAAAFAVKEYLYVPMIEGERWDNIENEFARFESDMIRLCRAKSREEFLDARVPIGNAIYGCLLHAFRDTYAYLAIAGQSGDGQNISRKSPQIFEEDTHRKLLTNTYGLMKSYQAIVPKWEWMVALNVPVNLIVSERPCFDMRFRVRDRAAVIFCPLSPNSALVGTGSNVEKPGGIMWTDASSRSPNRWQKWNEMTVERARQWIVSRDSDQLLAIAPQFTKEKMEQRIAMDKALFVIHNLGIK